ncbi:MAG: 4'-phosphopantetheinyl transferase superfamily protein [Flavobacteriales bacterium]|nr:4'-phosphopantetheinyl transferase superfamily protein [Flavobacteriales bacterium]
MGLLLRKELAENTILGVWKIEEKEAWYFANPIVTKRLQNRIDSYQFVKRKLQAIAVRILIELLLPDEDNIDISYNEKRKPFFTVAGYNLSITHSDTMVAVIVSDQLEVGIDIERESPKIKRIAHKFLSEVEFDRYNEVQESGQFDYLHIMWGAKECMFKLYGRGSLSFKENLAVSEFDLQSNGKFYGVIDKNKRVIKVDGYYIKLDKFVLVYVLENRDGTPNGIEP